MERETVYVVRDNQTGMFLGPNFEWVDRLRDAKMWDRVEHANDACLYQQDRTYGVQVTYELKREA